MEKSKANSAELKIYVTPDLKKLLKIRAIQRDVTLTELLRFLIRKELGQ